MASFAPWLRPLSCLAALHLHGCATTPEREVEWSMLPFVPTMPHWDQVCEPGPHPGFVRPSEIVSDEAGLRSLAEERLLRAGDGGGAQEPFVDVAVHYGADGRLRAAYVFESSFDETVAEAFAAAVRDRIRVQPRLLQPTALRLRAARGEDRATLQLLPALHCRPHITHEEDEPPRVAGDASLRGGRLLVATRRDQSIAVRLHISAQGELERVEALAGNEAFLERALRALSALDFDPALENGERVEGGYLDVVLEFEAPGDGSGAPTARSNDEP